MKCGHDEAALRMTQSGDTICSGCANPGQRMVIVTGAQRCHERNSRGERCTVVEHQFINNKDGQRSIVHETKHSLWIAPVTLKVLKSPQEADQ